MMQRSPCCVIVARLRPGSARTKKAPPCAMLVVLPSGSTLTAAPMPRGRPLPSTALTSAAALRRHRRFPIAGDLGIGRQRIDIDSNFVGYVGGHARQHEPAFRVGCAGRLVVEEDRCVRDP